MRLWLWLRGLSTLAIQLDYGVVAVEISEGLRSQGFSLGTRAAGGAPIHSPTSTPKTSESLKKVLNHTLGPQGFHATKRPSQKFRLILMKLLIK